MVQQCLCPNQVAQGGGSPPVSYTSPGRASLCSLPVSAISLFSVDCFSHQHAFIARSGFLSYTTDPAPINPLPGNVKHIWAQERLHFIAKNKRLFLIFHENAAPQPRRPPPTWTAFCAKVITTWLWLGTWNSNVHYETQREKPVCKALFNPTVSLLVLRALNN